MPVENPNFAEMTPDQFAEWKAAQTVSTPAEPLPTPAPPQSSYAATASAWGSGDSGAGKDFTTGYGHTVRVRPPHIGELMHGGLLARVNSLKPISDKLVKAGDNLPPEKVVEMVTEKDMGSLEKLLNDVLPMVMVQPKVYPLPQDGEERVDGRIYPDSVDTFEKMQIFAEAMKDVSALSTFRG